MEQQGWVHTGDHDRKSIVRIILHDHAILVGFLVMTEATLIVTLYSLSYTRGKRTPGNMKRKIRVSAGNRNDLLLSRLLVSPFRFRQLKQRLQGRHYHWMNRSILRFVESVSFSFSSYLHYNVPSHNYFLLVPPPICTPSRSFQTRGLLFHHNSMTKQLTTLFLNLWVGWRFWFCPPCLGCNMLFRSWFCACALFFF